MSTVCLNMIVKDEAHVIRRCLNSVRPFVDHWVIVDTGSTDETREIVRGCLSELPGELHERPWKDFGTNRTEALALARGKADYTLVIDADEVFLVPPGYRLPPLRADAYEILHRAGDSGTSFYLTQLVRSSMSWRYVGVLHEVIVCDEPHTTATLEGPVTHGHFDSARNTDPKKKYEADAALLERALEDEPDNARYVFYLAQSHRDAGNAERALREYRRRVEMGGWDEEVWYSLHQIGLLEISLGRDWPVALDSLLRAYQFRPSRAEPLCAIAAHYRQAGEHATAHLFAQAAVQIPRPPDRLFLDDATYGWRALDELAVSSYYVGKVEEARAANERLLASPALPAGERSRIEENLRFCVDALRGRPKPAKKRRGQRKRTRR